ncbi:cation diffusion facilitator family transporter [Chromatiaceae bacterium AAb-1]|nr:cation diffusion facilitator family transporter [Chromatiaceae bacterium AAb-1]
MTRFSPRLLLVLSLVAALLTMSLKTLAWYLTGSVGYLSDALESVVNLTGAIFALVMVTIAQRPADDSHPYGHSKAEYLSAAFEGGMIFLAAIAIFIAATDRLLNPQPLVTLGTGTALTILASLINLWMARLLLTGSKIHRSPALEGDGKHLMTDVWTTAGIVAGVLLAAATGHYWLDPLVAIAVALHILYEGSRLLYRSVNGLLDPALPADTISLIEHTLSQYRQEGVIFTNLRTRSAATMQFAHVDLNVPGYWTVAHAHQLADEAEQALAQQGIQLTTHIEPLPPVQAD